MLDTRKTDQFIKCHLKDSIYIGLDGRFAPWVGEVLKDINTPIVIICELNREKEQLLDYLELVRQLFGLYFVR